MKKTDPEFELSAALEEHFDRMSKFGAEALEGERVEVPVYVVEDAIQRLRRFSTIVENLTIIGNYLWMENLTKYGERKVTKKETPWGVYKDETYKRLCSFINVIGDDRLTIDDAFVELAMQMARFETGDPTGLSQYIQKEEELFDRLEFGESNG